jgi:hypothetical protein
MSAQGQAAAVNVPEIIASYQGSKTEFLRDQASHL